MRTLLATSLLLLMAAACSGAGSGQEDGGLPPVENDAGHDAGLDAGWEADGGTDGGTQGADPGFGDVSGPCRVLDDELTSAGPALFLNHLDFGQDPYDDADYATLTPGGQEIIDDGNAGGSSLLSEVFSYELLSRCEGAVLLKTETEVLYQDPMGKITDLLVELDGMKIGVSVTRAVAFPFEDPYTVQQAKDLLEKKLQGILDSTANVTPQDAWVKQILYVMAYGEGHATSLQTAFEQLDPSLKADTVVMVTVTDGDDAFIY